MADAPLHVDIRPRPQQQEHVVKPPRISSSESERLLIVIEIRVAPMIEKDSEEVRLFKTCCLAQGTRISLDSIVGIRSSFEQSCNGLKVLRIEDGIHQGSESVATLLVWICTLAHGTLNTNSIIAGNGFAQPQH